METKQIKITVFTAEEGFRETSDFVAIEAPLEVLVNGKGRFICMRMPGMDRELAAGLCYNSGLIESACDIKGVSVIDENRVNVEADNIMESPEDEVRIIRSSAGVIPDSQIQCDREKLQSDMNDKRFSGEMLFAMQNNFFSQQKIFDKTGATHAAALYDAGGGLLIFAEDVGRHNALDKCTGYMILNEKYGLGYFCILSSRLSYEMVVKGVRAGVSVIAGVSAPTGLAVSMARESGITLAGFVRKNRFNIYSGEWRIDKDFAGK